MTTTLSQLDARLARLEGHVARMHDRLDEVEHSLADTDRSDARRRVLVRAPAPEPETTEPGARIADERLLLRVPEAAEVLGVSRATVYQLLASGELRAVRLGDKMTRITRQALGDFVASLPSARDNGETS
jgi:excisionase family DNA binding protein